MLWMMKCHCNNLIIHKNGFSFNHEMPHCKKQTNQLILFILPTTCTWCVYTLYQRAYTVHHCKSNALMMTTIVILSRSTVRSTPCFVSRLLYSISNHIFCCCTRYKQCHVMNMGYFSFSNCTVFFWYTKVLEFINEQFIHGWLKVCEYGLGTQHREIGVQNYTEYRPQKLWLTKNQIKSSFTELWLEQGWKQNLHSGPENSNYCVQGKAGWEKAWNQAIA